MRKTYKSKTGISFNVHKTGAKKRTHVNFDPMTLNGSIFTTDDELLQEAIESHNFFKEGVITIDFVEEDDATPSPSDGEEKEEKKEVVEFGSVVEGKDYLAERYEVSRTQLRTRAAIESLAAEKGLTVVWKQ